MKREDGGHQTSEQLRRRPFVTGENTVGGGPIAPRLSAGFEHGRDGSPIFGGEHPESELSKAVEETIVGEARAQMFGRGQKGMLKSVFF